MQKLAHDNLKRGTILSLSVYALNRSGNRETLNCQVKLSEVIFSKRCPWRRRRQRVLDLRIACNISNTKNRV